MEMWEKEWAQIINTLITAERKQNNGKMQSFFYGEKPLLKV